MKKIFRQNRILFSAIIVFIVVITLCVGAFPISAAPSVFDWDVHSWPLGSLTQTYTGIGSPATDFTFTFTGATSRLVNSPVTNQVITGGITPPENTLFIARDFVNTGESIILTVDLSREATNVSFLVMDVDQNPNVVDQIVVAGSDALNAVVIPTLTATDPLCVQVVGNVATGLCSVNNNLNNGNVTVTFNAAVNKIAIVYRDGGTASDPPSNGIAIYDIHFDPQSPTSTSTATATSTETSTPTSTSTPTNTPTATSTSTPTATPTSTSVSQPRKPVYLPAIFK